MRLTRRGKRRLVVLVALVGLVGIAIVGFRQIRSVQQSRLVAQARTAGLDAHRAGDPEKTLSELRYVFQHDRQDLEVTLALADARLRMPLADGRHMQEALSYYKHAISLIEQNPEIGTDDPAYSDSLRRMLDLYMSLGLRFELIHIADQILQFAPDDIEALGAKARALFTDRLFDDTLVIVDRLIEMEPEVLQWRQFKLETLNQLRADDNTMLALCDEWHEGYDGDGRYLLLKAGLLAHMGRSEEARQAANAAADRGADAIEVLQLMISLLDAIGERDRASAVVAAARSKFPKEQWVHEATIRRHWQASQYSDGLEQLAVVEAEFPRLDPDLLKLKALLLAATERFDEAERALGELQGSGSDATDPNVAWSRAIQARMRLEQTSWRDSMRDMHQALVLHPKDPVIHYVCGEIYAQIGETGRALEFYRDAHALDRDWIAGGVAYGEILLATGRIDDAYEVARTLLGRATGGQPSVFMLFARTYLALRQTGGDMLMSLQSTGERIEVSAILGPIYELMPDSADAAALLVEAHLDEGRVDRAQRTIEAIVAHEATTPQVLLRLVEVSRRYRLDLEQQLLDRARHLGADDLAYSFSRATVLADGGDVAGGLALIDEAVEAARHDAAASREARQRRVAYLLRTDLPEAGPAMRRLAEDFEDSPTIQSFVLAQSIAWTDRELVSATIERLRAVVGDDSQQVHLAEANFLLRYEAEDEAQLAKAIVLINEVLEESTESLPAMMLMARASMLGDHPAPQRAIEHLARAINTYPHEVTLYGQLIHLLQQAGDFERAERYLYRLGKLSASRPELRRTELQLLQAQGDYETAMVRAAEMFDSASPESDQLLLAAMQMQAGRHDEAERTYRRLLASGRPSEFVLAQAADFFAITGNFEEGVALLEQSEPAGGPAMKSLLLGTYYQRHGDLENAGQHLKHAVALDRSLASASHHLARHFLARSDRMSAREEALRGLQLDPQHVGLRATLAITELGLGREGRAEALELLRDLGDENDHLLATLSLLQEVPVDAEGALQPNPRNLAAAIELVNEHGQFMPSWLLAISLHVESGRIEEAIDLARRAVGRLPTQPEPAEWATSLLVEARRFDEALTEAHEWRRRSLASPLAVELMIASILLELGRPGDALVELQPFADRLVRERSHFPGHFALWLEVLVRAGEQERADALMTQLAAEDARWRATWTSLTSSMADDAAYEALSTVEANAAGEAELLQLAVAWSSLGKRSQRNDCFERADRLARQVELQPEAKLHAWIVLGGIAEERGDVEAAMAHYRKVLDADARNAMALNNLGFAKARHDGAYEEALELVELALEVLPDQPNVLDTYAFVLLGLDRLTDAEEALDRALAQRPYDVGLRIRMIELQVRADRTDEATESLRRLELELAGQLPVRRRYSERLDALELQLQQQSAAAGS